MKILANPNALMPNKVIKIYFRKDRNGITLGILPNINEIMQFELLIFDKQVCQTEISKRCHPI